MLALLVIYFAIMSNIQAHLEEQVKRTFEGFKYLILVTEFKYLGLGLILGLVHLINEIKSEGEWTINTPKLIFIALPSFLFSFFYILNFLPLGISMPFFMPVMKLLASDSFPREIISVIFGYSVITAFYRKELT